jgi:hypothetical protein
MPPKRRKTLDKTGKERGGPPSKKRTQDIPHESTDTTTGTADQDGVSSMMKVPELYKICIVEGDRREQADKVRVWEERGAISEIVWPFLVEHVASDNAAEFLQGCELLVTFVSRKCRDGSFSSSGVLEALDSKTVIDKLLDKLFYQTDEKDVALQTKIVHFLIVVLSSDNSNLQKAALKHVSGMPIWYWMPERRRALELKKSAGLRRKFVDSEKRDVWIVKNIRQIMTTLQGHNSVHLGGEHQDADVDESATGPIPTESWQFLHRSMELMIDLLSMVTTRLYLVTYVDAIHFIVHCRMALGKASLDLSSDNDNNIRLTRQMLRRIDQLLTFPIKDANHEHLSKADVMSMYHSRATVLQKMAHRHFPLKLQHVIHAGVGLLCARQQKNSYLERSFAGFAEQNLQKLLYLMRLIDSDSDPVDKEIMLKVLAHHLSIAPYPMEQLKAFPLYPTESLLWDINIIPPSSRNLRSTSVLALPKLNCQFLSFQDYLLRNFELVRLESAYEIRSDLVDVIKRIRPVLRQINFDDSEALQFKTEFNGWSRMALELAKSVSIVEVRPPKLGETSSSKVTAEVVVDLDACGEAIRNEWNAIGEFDNLFLVAVDASNMTGAPAPLLSENHDEYRRPSKSDSGERRVPDDEDSTFPQRFGVTLVRGCMVLHVRDEEGNILSDPAFEAKPKKSMSRKRIFRVALDPAQYSADSKSIAGTEIYQVSIELSAALTV